MTPSAADLIRVLPEIIWCGFGVLLMLLQPYLKNRQGLTLFAMVGAAVGTLATYFGQMGSGFFGLIQFDTYSLFFHWLVGLVAFLVILASDSYLERENLAPAEFYALILFATAGMGVLASAQELLTAFIGLEMSSISSYVLAGYRRDAVKSSESAVKYFLLGSFATAFFLYGIALVYGASGSTNLAQIASADASSNLLRLGLTLILVGLGFKGAAAPFQVWTPDVYEGAPTIVTEIGGQGERYLTLDDFAGLGTRQPFAAAAMTLFLLSLLGMPITAGFFGKFYVFKAAINSKLIWLAVLMTINTAIGAYYYLRVIVVMYMREHKGDVPADAAPSLSPTAAMVVAVAALAPLDFRVLANHVLGIVLSQNLILSAR